MYPTRDASPLPPSLLHPGHPHYPPQATARTSSSISSRRPLLVHIQAPPHHQLPSTSKRLLIHQLPSTSLKSQSRSSQSVTSLPGSLPHQPVLSLGHRRFTCARKEGGGSGILPSGWGTECGEEPSTVVAEVNHLDVVVELQAGIEDHSAHAKDGVCPGWNGWIQIWLLEKHTSLSPDGKLVVIVGDDPNGLLIDANSGKTLHSMKGHHDFSFASAWSPDGRTFATGNQDKTCRIWDARNLSKAVHVLKGNLGAIRSIRFTSDGQFLSMAEPADFVHIFDVKSDYKRRQELDFFGEISGMSFSPDTDALFVGVWDRTYGSLLQFGRLYNNWYHDSLL